jgi:RHS repeat-associated protein
MDYDAFGDRVRIQKLAGGQVVAGADTLEFGGLIARQPDGRLSFHVVVDNEVVAIISKTTSGSTWSEDVRYVFSDALGSPSAMVSSSGAVVDRPRYSPFGERRAGANLTSPSTARHPERLGFAAHVPDDDWGSVKMGVRSFDPRTTRFLSPDPLYNPGQQLNPYSYAANSPVNNVDPFGLSCAPTEPAAGWLCATYGTSVFSVFVGGPAAAVTGPGPTAMPPLTPTAGPAVDDGNRGAPTPLSAGAAATAFGFGALKGVAAGLGGVYALGAVAGVCPPCAVGIGAGLLVYGVYGLVNGGAASLLASGTRIYNGVGTAEDFDSAGALLGGIASGGLSRSAFARGGADGVRALGAMKGILKPSSGCVGGSCSIAAEATAAKPKPFAMGLTDEGLEVFASARGATTWKQLPDPANWRSGVLEKLADPKTQVHFNLDGVDVWPGVSRAASGRGGPTDWELLTIKQNPQFWDTLQFWEGGQPAANPFQ